MGSLGFSELFLIFAVVLLIFGAKKLPGLGGAIGEGIRNFKKGLQDPEEEKARLEAEKKKLGGNSDGSHTS